MPLGFGGATFTSSSGGDIGGGRQYTRLRGPVFLGTPMSAEAPGGSYATGASKTPPHIINASTQYADLCIVPTTFMTTGAAAVSTGTPTGLVWISMTTGNLIAAGSTANAPSPFTGGATAAALCWDDTQKTLAVYSPGSSAWLWPHAMQSTAAAQLGASLVWSASSS